MPLDQESAIKIMVLNLLTAELLDHIFQQSLENQFSTLDIVSEVTFSFVTCESQESSSSFQSTSCLGKCIHWNSKKKNNSLQEVIWSW